MSAWDQLADLSGQSEPQSLPDSSTDLRARRSDLTQQQTGQALQRMTGAQFAARSASDVPIPEGVDADPRLAAGETYEDADNRVAKVQNYQQRQFDRENNSAASAMRQMRMPFTRTNGAVQPITDKTGSPLTNQITPTIAYDSAGNPVDFSQQDGSGAPVLRDPYANVPVTTDPKTGDIYKKHPDLGWQWVGKDDHVAARAAADSQNKLDNEASGALAGAESQTAKLAREAVGQAKKSLKDTTKTLTGLGVPLVDGAGQPIDLTQADPDELKSHIEDTFNTRYAAPEANATHFFGGGYTPDALALRHQLDQDKLKAMQAVDSHFTTVQHAGDAQDSLTAIQQQRQALQAGKLDAVNRQRVDAGLEPVQPAQPMAAATFAASTPDTGTDQPQPPGVEQDVPRGTEPGAEPASLYDSSKSILGKLVDYTNPLSLLGDRGKNFGRQVIGSIAEGAGSAITGAADWAAHVQKYPLDMMVPGLSKQLGIQAILPGAYDAEVKPLRLLGQSLKSVPGVITDPAMNENGEAKAGRLVGGVGSLIAQGAVAPQTLIPTLFAQGYSGQYDAAKTYAAQHNQPFDEDTAHKAGIIGGGINAILGVPLGEYGKTAAALFGKADTNVVRAALDNAYEANGSKGVADILTRMRSFLEQTQGDEAATIFKGAAMDGLKNVVDEITKTAGQRVLSIAGRAATDAALGGATQLAQNLTEKTYNPDKDAMEGVAGQAGTFALLGGLFGAIRERGAAAKAAEARGDITRAQRLPMLGGEPPPEAAPEPPPSVEPTIPGVTEPASATAQTEGVAPEPQGQAGSLQGESSQADLRTELADLQQRVQRQPTSQTDAALLDAEKGRIKEIEAQIAPTPPPKKRAARMPVAPPAPVAEPEPPVETPSADAAGQAAGPESTAEPLEPAAGAGTEPPVAVPAEPTIPGVEPLAPQQTYAEAQQQIHPPATPEQHAAAQAHLDSPAAKEVVDRLSRLKGVEAVDAESGDAFSTNEKTAKTTINTRALAHALAALHGEAAKRDYVVKGLDEELKHQATLIAIPHAEREAIGNGLSKEERGAVEGLYGAKMTDAQAGAEAIRAFMQGAEGNPTEAFKLFTDKAKTDSKFRQAIKKALRLIRDIADKIKSGELKTRLAEGIRKVQAVLDGLERDIAKEKKKTATPEGTEIKKGEVGQMLSSGEIVKTLSGRETTPFPKIDTTSERKTGNTLKRVDAWLRENAILEAESRGDHFNALQFNASKAASLTQAEKDSMEEYLFGHQPEVPRPLLKPISSKTPLNQNDLEEDINDWIKSALTAKRPPESADDAWLKYSAFDRSRGMPTDGEKYFKEAWGAFAKNKSPKPTEAKIVAPKKSLRRKVPEAPGGTDAIDRLISEVGHIQHPFAAYRAQQKREGKTPFQKTSLGGEWDRWKDLPAGLKQLIFKKGSSINPDGAATAAAERGIIPHGSGPDQLLDEIKSAWTSRVNHAAASKEQQADIATAERQATDFQKDSQVKAPGDQTIPSDELKKGDVVEVSGQKLKVIDVDEEGIVTLEDHIRYGVQTLESGEVIYGELDKTNEESTDFLSESDVDPVAEAAKVETPEAADEIIAKHQYSTEDSAEQSAETPTIGTPQGGEVDDQGQGGTGAAERGGAVAEKHSDTLKRHIDTLQSKIDSDKRRSISHPEDKARMEKLKRDWSAAMTREQEATPKLTPGQDQGDLLTGGDENTGKVATITNEEAGTLARIGGQVVANLKQKGGTFTPHFNEAGDKLTREQREEVVRATNAYTKQWQQAKIREGQRKTLSSKGQGSQDDMLDARESDAPLFSGTNKPGALAEKSPVKLTEKEQQAKDALGDLLGAAMPESGDFNASFPPEKQKAIVSAFMDLASEANTPEKFAAALDKMGPKARPFTQKLWYIALSGGAEGPPIPNWASTYAAIDKAKAETDAAEQDVQRSRPNLEPDRAPAEPGDAGGEGGLRTEPGADDENGKQVERTGDESRDPGNSGPLSSEVPSAPTRVPRDRPIRGESPDLPERTAGDSELGRSQPRDEGRPQPDQRGPEDIADGPGIPGEPAAMAGGGDVGEGSLEDIQKSSPVLHPEQVKDVAFIENAHRTLKRPGVLITNGTGTGKTFTGLGAIKRELDRGSRHVLIMLPNDGIGKDWVKAAKSAFGINDIAQVGDTQDNGAGNRVVVANYANVYQNNSLVKRPWTMVVADESHKLMEGKDGKPTEWLNTMRALTWNPQGIQTRARMLDPVSYDRLQELNAQQKKRNGLPFNLIEEQDRLRTKVNAGLAKIRADAPAKEDRPKVLFLSATPFAHQKDLDYAEGYIFDYPEVPKNRRYNDPDGRQKFFMENLGWRMSHNKLTAPENSVAQGILERRMAERFMREKVMRGRQLEVDADYARNYVLTENTMGRRIDEIMDAMDSSPRLKTLREHLGVSDYLQRRYLLEALKAKDAIPRIKTLLKNGFKVVVFHDYKKGGSVNPLRPTFGPSSTGFYHPEGAPSGEMRKVLLADVFEELKDMIPDWDDISSQLDNLGAPIDQLKKEFSPEQLGIYNGDVPAKQRERVKHAFNTSGGPMNILMAQRDAGKQGISAHDIDGKHRRWHIDLGIPAKPTDQIQSEGRTYRLGVKSNAVFDYLVTGTNWERWTFAQTIAQRAATAENLAMGERARSLLQSIADGFNSAEPMEAGVSDGTGGKAKDAARNNSNPFQDAVALYYTNQKKTAKNKAAEGVDYFATPEPVGFKMVEWLKPEEGETLLEPSAGHGAIARFFPDGTNRVGIEPSNELAGRLALNATDIDVKNQRFEDYHIANKADGIAMNPPWGVGGKVAMEHLAKAVQHLRTGGRIVALIPRGQMDDRFDKWSGSAEGAHMATRAVFDLPAVTFQRAGTNVSGRIVVMDKMPWGLKFDGNKYQVVNEHGTTKQEFDDRSAAVQWMQDHDAPHAKVSGRAFEAVYPKQIKADDIKELFDEIQHITVPERPEIPHLQGAAEPARPHFDTPINPNAPSAPGGRQVLPNRDSVLPSQPATASTLPIPPRESTWSPADFKHTKTGAPVFVARIMRELSKQDFSAAKSRAYSLSGYYSSFKGAGAIPGFHFKTAEARDRFIGQQTPLGAAMPERSSSTAILSEPNTPMSRQFGAEKPSKDDKNVLIGEFGSRRYIHRDPDGKIDAGLLIGRRPGIKSGPYQLQLMETSVTSQRGGLMRGLFGKAVRDVGKLLDASEYYAEGKALRASLPPSHFVRSQEDRAPFAASPIDPKRQRQLELIASRRALKPDEQAELDRLKSPYANVSDSLMGFPKEGPTKPFEEQNYSHVQPVRVTWPDGDSIVDAVKGLNQPHAMERARRNWDGAKVEPISDAEYANDDKGGTPLAAASPLWEATVRRMTPGLDVAKNATEGVQSLLLPGAVSPAHLDAANIVGPRLGEMHHSEESDVHQAEPERKLFERMGVSNEKTPVEKNPGATFMSAASAGRPLPPELQKIKEEKIDKPFERVADALEKAGVPIEKVRESYFPGIWTKDSHRAFSQAFDEAKKRGDIPADFDINASNPPIEKAISDRVKEIMAKGGGSDSRAGAELLAKRPLEGKGSFKKPKVFDDVGTGFKYGLKPASFNPIVMRNLKLAEMRRFLMAHQVFNDFEAKGDLINVDNNGKPMKKANQAGFNKDDWAKLDDKYGTIWRRDPETGALIKQGERWAKKPVADILNNYLSSSLYNNRYFGDVYKVWMAWANLMNQSQLGVGSAFHAGFTAVESQVSAISNVLKDFYGLLRGNRSAKDFLATLARAPIAMYENPATGDKVLNAWRNPDGQMDPRIAQVVRAAELAGAGFTMEKGLQTSQLDKMHSDWFGGNKLRAAARSPVAAIELMAQPIMNWLVPRQKAGVFAHLVWRIIEQNPGKTMEELAPQFRQAWNRVDARLGQVRYDRVFMNNVAKNVIQGLIRAPGWSGGTIAELGGAFKDAGNFFREWQKTGKMPQDLPDRTAYAIALLLGVAAVNAALTYAFTGKKPEGNDYMAFRSGREDENGNPERFMLPSYMKDVWAYMHHPGQTLVNKSHPLLSLFGELIKNKDYYGVQVRDTDASALKQAEQAGLHVVKAFTPFWMRGAQTARERGKGVGETLAPLVGVMPAPKEMNQSPAYRLAAQINRDRLPSAPITEQQSEHRIARSNAVQAMRRGDSGPLQQAIQSGTLKPSDARGIQQKAALAPLVAQVKSLPLDQAERVYRIATPEERQQLDPIMAAKRGRAPKQNSTMSAWERMKAA